MLWSFRVIQPQIQFHPCSGRSFLPGPDYFAWESSYIWSRVSMERGNCYISPPYCSKLLHFTLILVLREKILWRQDYRDWRTNHVCAGGGDDDGASQMDMRTNIMITCCMDSAYFNLMKWTRKTWRIRNKTKNVCLLPSQTSNKNNIYSYNYYTKTVLLVLEVVYWAFGLASPVYGTLIWQLGDVFGPSLPSSQEKMDDNQKGKGGGEMRKVE